MKALFFDSSSIISLALNDLLYILEPLKKEFKGEFYITPDIKAEVIDYSLNTKRFMLEALMVKKLIDKGILKIYNKKFNFRKFLDMANKTFKADGKFINLLHRGEASCIAAYRSFNEQKKAIVIDERTTRMLCEAPDKLKDLLEKKLSKKIQPVKDNFKFFKDINIIRSSELAFLALNKKILEFQATKTKVREALLYALKFKGCAISTQEINEAIKI
ncbi:MAG: hypothetical protein JSW08_04065 [archaeon]|nr:MAG: hypothetical protein JSW08_04065 [archaeon]